MRLWILIILALLLISCGDDDPNRPDLPPTPPLQATSPEEVTDLLIVALEGRNIERYDSLLTVDYTFVFNPLDTQNDSLDLPETWGHPQEIEALICSLTLPWKGSRCNGRRTRRGLPTLPTQISRSSFETLSSRSHSGSRTASWSSSRQEEIAGST
jgi:hypothetical protein